MTPKHGKKFECPFILYNYSLLLYRLGPLGQLKCPAGLNEFCGNFCKRLTFINIDEQTKQTNACFRLGLYQSHPVPFHAQQSPGTICTLIQHLANHFLSSWKCPSWVVLTAPRTTKVSTELTRAWSALELTREVGEVRCQELSTISLSRSLSLLWRQWWPSGLSWCGNVSMF